MFMLAMTLMVRTSYTSWPVVNYPDLLKGKVDRLMKPNWDWSEDSCSHDGQLPQRISTNLI